MNMASANTKEEHTDRNDNLLLNLLKNAVKKKLKDDEKMCLTNLHVKQMLQKEFNINLKNKSELEVEIYMNIFKHFFKSWPHWVELKSIQESDVNFDSVLYTKSKNLQEYLAQVLETAEKEMGPMIADYNEEEQVCNQQNEEETTEEETSEEETTEELVLEVACSRLQLNQLIFRQPHPLQNNTIFNIVESAGPSKVSLQYISLKHIVNWPDIRIKMILPDLECQRYNSNHVKRTIVNMKITENAKRLDNKYPLNINNIHHRKFFSSAMQKTHKENILGYLDKLSGYVIENKIMRPVQMEMFLYVIQQYRMDFENLDMHAQFGEYKFYLNNFKYVRYSSTEVPGPEEGGESSEFADNFDLRLEEILTPCNMFEFTKLNLTHNNETEFSFDNNVFRDISWLVVDCTICGQTFNVGSDCFNLESHFKDCHQTNEEWNCSGCHKTFSFLYLTENRWYHKCEVNSE